MKLIGHVLMFVVGAAVGIWWGVNHPVQAVALDAKMQEAASKAKIDVLNKIIQNQTTPDPNNAKYQQMLQEEQQKLQDAQKQTGQ